MADINADKRATVEDELSGDGRAVRSIAADITDAHNDERIIDAAVTAFGHLDGLVNTAIALGEPAPFEELTDEMYNLVFETGAHATLRLMQLAYPHLKAQGGGSIVNFGSGAGTYGEPMFGAYGGSKEAIRGMSKVAAIEWGKDQIRVNCICPAASSPSMESWRAENPQAWEKVAANIPLGRVGDVLTDVAPVLAFLLGDDAVYLTGTTIFVDGGQGSLR